MSMKYEYYNLMKRNQGYKNVYTHTRNIFKRAPIIYEI